MRFENKKKMLIYIFVLNKIFKFIFNQKGHKN